MASSRKSPDSSEEVFLVENLKPGDIIEVGGMDVPARCTRAQVVFVQPDEAMALVSPINELGIRMALPRYIISDEHNYILEVNGNEVF